MSSLSEWGELIQRLGEESRQRDNEALAEAESQFPAKAAEMQALDNVALVEHFQAYVCRSFADPRMTAVTQRMADVCRTELLGRLAGTRPLNPVTANSN